MSLFLRQVNTSGFSPTKTGVAFRQCIAFPAYMMLLFSGWVSSTCFIGGGMQMEGTPMYSHYCGRGWI